MASNLTSTELNLLVYRYLLESGFQHAAFTFGYEAMVHRNGLSEKDVPPAALITFVQKGLQYLELETNLNEEGTVVEGDFMGLTPADLISKSADELRTLVQGRREQREQERADLAERQAQGAEAGPSVIPEARVRVLQGHSGEVFSCSWNPVCNLLASGAGDRTARIWDLTGGPGRGGASIELHHQLKKEKDVTTLDWSPDGQLLATGSYDGLARIWSRDGACQATLAGHAGPVFALKWNKKGDLLLTGSVDKTAIVWNARQGGIRQQFAHHAAPTLDVDWKNNSTFATSSSDRTIQVCRVGEEAPLKTFLGHQDEVNGIKWDPQGKLLVSCSDDTTAKVWSMGQDTCVHDLTLHTKEIYTMKWSPSGPGSANPGQPLLLATASFDTSIRVWEMERGQCVHHLTGHSQPAYSLSFSPDGRYLASGGFDRVIRVWSVRDGRLARTYEAAGGFFEVCWNRDGDLLAACANDKTVSIIDMRF